MAPEFRGGGRRDAARGRGGREASVRAASPGRGKAEGGRSAGGAGPSGRDGGCGGEVDGAQYKTDQFRMFCLKVLQCSKRYCHDWTTCPFAHPGEKARRRDPRKCRYTGIACPEMKQGVGCPRRERCPFAHNVFEYWLHPSRYRTQLCNIAASCNRKICFFAHTIEELRVPAPVGGVDATQLLAGARGQPQPTGATPAFQRGADKAAGPTPRRTAAVEPVRRVAAPAPRQSVPSPAPPSSLYSSDQVAGHRPAFSQPAAPNGAATYSESQARQLLELLRSTRQQALQVHPSVPFADVQQVQTLLSILQQQQQQLAQEAARKAADSDAGMTRALQSCLSALYYQVTVQPMLETERERLVKMLSWIFMMVQSHSLQAFGGDMQGPWDDPATQSMVLGADISIDQPPVGPPAPSSERGTSSFSDRGSLNSIPEMQTAGMDILGIHRGHGPSQWGTSPQLVGAQYEGAVVGRPGRADLGEVHRRRSPAEGYGHPAMVAEAVATRLSSDSGWSARASGSVEMGWGARTETPRFSAHSSGESAVTELWGMLSRQSGDSTNRSSSVSMSDAADAWVRDYGVLHR
ncbi:unnamed protein product [Ostreobium quekettii]|uniref:C3H1-type domain-containing protein n=1 Tax=Ostreobium quekettii TaxID=121088 RepID=A0A8S1J5Q4_9CHLO|nr:unnamed protein product [Ostreobium quekettii]|eukprot:evm.model.scf_1292.1 EVM.evm.TU.scf_1292.1   scf_1292:2486-8260(+)